MARDAKFYRGRALGAAVIGVGSLLVVYYGGLLGAMGKQIFLEVVGRVLAAGAIFAGVNAASDLISSERREGTLELLFLTPLRPLEILLGKYAAANLGAMVGIVGGFPILALVMSQAGVGMVQLLHVALGLVLALLVASGLALLGSSWCSDRRAAMGLGTVFALILLMGIPGLAEALRQEFRGKPWGDWVSKLDLGMLVSPLSLQKFGGRANYWSTAAITTSIGFAALVFAWKCLSGLRVSHPPVGNRPSFKQRWAQRAYGKPGERLAFRRQTLDVNPFQWLCVRDRLRRYYPVGLLLLLLGFLCWFIVEEPSALNEFTFHMVMTFLLVFVARAMFAGESARRFSEDRDQGALELLLTTPISARTLLKGHARGCRAQLFVILTLTVVAFGWLLALSTVGRFIVRDDYIPAVVHGTIVVVFIWFLLGFVSQPLIGAWAGLTARKTRTAGGISFLAGVLLPLVLFMVTYVSLALLAQYDWIRVPDGFNTELFFLGLFAFYSIGSDLLWILVLRRAIPRRMMEWASRRLSVDADGDWFEKLFRRFFPAS